MVIHRTLPQPPRPANLARCFNERSQGIMRKIHILTSTFSDFGVEVALLIKTPHVELTYESKDGMLCDFDTNLPEENRFRPQDVADLFQGRVLACPSIHPMSPLRNRSGQSSPTPSTSSTASTSFVPLPTATELWLPTSPPTHPAGPDTRLPSSSPISVSLPPAAETGVTVPTSPSPPQGDTSPSPPQGDTTLPSTSPISVSLPSAAESGVTLATSLSPPQGESLSFSTTSSSPPLMSDFSYPMSPAMDISNLLNLECWPAASDVPFPDETVHRPLPSSRPIRTKTPTPSVGGRFRQQSYRVVKFRAPRGKWFD